MFLGRASEFDLRMDFRDNMTYQHSYVPSQTLLNIIDRIFVILGRPLLDWSVNDCPYSRNIYSPKNLETQMDDWSCGLFVLMALVAMRQGSRLEDVGKSQLDEMRRNAVRMLMNIPLSIASIPLTYRLTPCSQDNQSLLRLRPTMGQRRSGLPQRSKDIGG